MSPVIMVARIGGEEIHVGKCSYGWRDKVRDTTLLESLWEQDCPQYPAVFGDPAKAATTRSRVAGDQLQEQAASTRVVGRPA